MKRRKKKKKNKEEKKEEKKKRRNGYWWKRKEKKVIKERLDESSNEMTKWVKKVRRKKKRRLETRSSCLFICFEFLDGGESDKGKDERRELRCENEWSGKTRSVIRFTRFFVFFFCCKKFQIVFELIRSFRKTLRWRTEKNKKKKKS